MKRIGFLSSDGTPTKLYDSFRNASSAGAAMAEGMKIGYKDIFDRSEYAYEMSREKLHALVVEMTGLEKDNRVVQATVATFWALKEFANFEAKAEFDAVPVKPDAVAINETQSSRNSIPEHSKQMELRVGYTINLNLPETTNPDVFNAIFRALKENLL